MYIGMSRLVQYVVAHQQYTSGCPLEEPSGIMVGRYLMISENGDKFEIDIPAFSLDSPDGLGSIN